MNPVIVVTRPEDRQAAAVQEFWDDPTWSADAPPATISRTDRALAPAMGEFVDMEALLDAADRQA